MSGTLVTALVISGIGVSIYLLGGGKFRWKLDDGGEGEAASVMAAVRAAQEEIGQPWYERITEEV